MNYRMDHDKYAGFVDLTISEAYIYYPECLTSHGLLVTCLDSTDAVATLDKWLESLSLAKISHEVINRAVYIPQASVSALFAHGKTFYGFDEIYLVQSPPTSIPEGRFTTDGFDFGEEIPKEFWEIFDALGAVRYFADGCGLNFVCESRDIAERLELIEMKNSKKRQEENRGHSS
ncbi:MAG: hypothetical protein MN733_35160 [Nitrososphaera sp.]|nr:hypothetical protein [Nitrososphaera sp.]